LNHHFSPHLVHAHPNNDITPATSQNSIWHSITNKRYSLNCWWYSMVHKNSCSQLIIFFSFSIEKEYNPPVFTVPPLCYLTSGAPTKSNLCLANSLAAVVR